MAASPKNQSGDQALLEAEIKAVEANLFPRIRSLVRDDPGFPWHRDRSKAVTASRVVSSQALAVDVFGTIQRLSSRDLIVGEWTKHLQLPFAGPWKLELESLVPKSLLGEPRSTQIDVLASGATGLIVFECKFTEPDGGSCSQPTPISKGANAGKRQCTGSYVDQVNPVNGIQSRCALTGKGIRYWSLVPEVMNVDSERDQVPCPFAGGWYQWMRNLVSALALGCERDVPAAFVVVYADGPFHMAGKIGGDGWRDLVAAVAGRAIPLRAVSYQQLLQLARSVSLPEDVKVLGELSEWLDRKVSEALKALASPQVRAVGG